jgi:hypothetical protein
MRPLVAVAAALSCTLACLPGGASAASAPAKPVWAGTCGLPNQTTTWMDFGQPQFLQLFGRPGVIVSSSSGAFPGQVRATGAQTVYWDMHLNARVGTPTAPTDPSTIVARADKLYEFASSQLACSTPVIIENELFGASLPTPWSDSNAQYRQNVLTFLTELAKRGAYPMLLVNSTPYTDGDAGVWWQQVAQVSDLVREVYVPATQLWAEGPILANRTLRNRYRDAVDQLTTIGIPPQRIGLIVTMATTIGFGGRNGLKPASAWFDTVKWQALSLRQVAAETHVSSLWSWGWGEWSKAEQDPDKQAAACVWLWTRYPSFCDGPAAAGPGFDASRTEGQIRLAAGTQCRIGTDVITKAQIAALQLVTGDFDIAFSALQQRIVEDRKIQVPQARVLAAERAVVASRFRGSWSAYGAALRAAHANRSIALAVLGDELRRDEISASLPAGNPTASQVTTFYTSYPDLLVRHVKSKTPVPWLDGRTSGYALSQIAPAELFTAKLGKRSLLQTPLGSYSITPAGDAVPMGALQLSQVRPSIVAALREFARGAAFERWSTAAQRDAQDQAICLGDNLPQPAAPDLTTYLPFLSPSGW